MYTPIVAKSQQIDLGIQSYINLRQCCLRQLQYPGLANCNHHKQLYFEILPNICTITPRYMILANPTDITRKAYKILQKIKISQALHISCVTLLQNRGTVLLHVPASHDK
jgi:hypothetical protein